MTTATTALIVVACTCVLYILEIFPVSVTTLIGMLAMVFTGVLNVSDAFSGFTNTAVMLVIGMVIIIDALLASGVSSKIGKFLMKFVGKSEKIFLIIVFLSAGFISMFVTNAALVAMFMPFISSVALASKGTISKKNTYLTLAAGGLIGGTGTLVGSTAPLLASNALTASGLEGMSFFTPFPIALAIMIVVSVCYWVFMYKIQVKCFDFPEVEDENIDNLTEIPINKRNAIISITVFLICVVLFITQPFGWDLGLIAISGAVFLVITKCVDGELAMKNMFWSTIVTLGAALGIAKGFVNSGIGQIIINWLINVLGEGIANPVVMMTLFLVSGYILSLFMPNGALVSMLSAIAVPMAIEVSSNPMPIVLAIVFGCSLAMATPAATTTITMVQVAGYRFKDYFRMGGLIGLIGLATTWVCLVLMYRMI